MSALAHSVKKASAFARFSAGSRERLQKSFRVFLLGVVVACGIEVAIDWHSTLGEVRSLRERVRERGENYVAVLMHPLAPVVAARDRASMDRLIGGAFDDDEVIYARVTGVAGDILYERIDPTYAAGFEARRGASFTTYYAHQLERDSKGITNDPEGLRARMEHSRYHDVPQAYQDLLVSLHVAKPPAPHTRADFILFQDRLYTSNKGEHDPTVTYALGRIDGTDGKPLGALVVAFDMRPTNAEIRGKYLKGGGLVLFFVLLILVQNVSTRREKLRLLDLESKYASAKDSIRAALPKALEAGELRVAGAIAQSVGSVDGMLWDLEPKGSGVEVLVVDPEGDGVEAAASALHLRAMYRQRREQNTEADVYEELGAIGDAARRIPGKRATGVVLVRVDANGGISGLRCGMGALRILSSDGTSPVDERPGKEAPPGVVGPVFEVSGTIPPGALLLVVTDGLGGATKRVDPDAVAAFVARSESRADLGRLLDDATTWARGTSSEIKQDDIIVLGIERASTSR